MRSLDVFHVCNVSTVSTSLSSLSAISTPIRLRFHSAPSRHQAEPSLHWDRRPVCRWTSADVNRAVASQSRGQGPHQLPCGANGEAQWHRHVNLETGTLKLGFLGHKWAPSHNLQTYRKTGLGGHHLSSLVIGSTTLDPCVMNSQWPNLCRVEAEMPTSLRIGNQQGLRGKYPGSCCQSICIRALSLHIITFEN